MKNYLNDYIVLGHGRLEDFKGDEARVLGIHQIADFIADFKKKMDCPTFILGDFNAKPESEIPLSDHYPICLEIEI